MSLILCTAEDIQVIHDILMIKYTSGIEKKCSTEDVQLSNCRKHLQLLSPLSSLANLETELSLDQNQNDINVISYL